MFLIHAILVIFTAYWISALIAETVMTSESESSLAPALRAGFGFLISLVYFAAAWLILSPQQAWLLGILLLSLYGLGKTGFKPLLSPLKTVSLFFKKYIRSCLCFVVGSLLFFAPLVISNHYGPFTEGGGDISIYADTAIYAQDKHLSEIGSNASSLTNIIKNAKEALWPKVVAEQWGSLNNYLLNPPAGEFSTYRVIMLRSTNVFFYFPYAAYGFLSGKTNYPVYFGIQALFYLFIYS